jgi:hypothetical protein
MTFDVTCCMTFDHLCNQVSRHSFERLTIYDISTIVIHDISIYLNTHSQPPSIPSEDLVDMTLEEHDET